LRARGRAVAGHSPVLVLTSHHAPDAPVGTPRLDFVELAATLQAGVSFPPRDPGRFARLERRTGLAFRQAHAARRAGAAALYVSLNEGLGLPLATFDRGRVPHVMVAHNLLRPRMRLYESASHSLRRIDRVVVLSRAHGEFLTTRAGVAAQRVSFLHDKVDHRFWAPRAAPGSGSVLSVGRERRDYETLFEALRPLAVQADVVDGSLWARGDHEPRSDPGEVRFHRRISFERLRDLYASAAVVVVPLLGGEVYAAGVNAVMEAMAMGKALVVTDTPGIADYVTDGETGRLVPAGDVAALRDVLSELLGDDAERRRLGANARAVIDAGRNLDGYVIALAKLVGEVRAERG
jgi:glycosyltransferase involved in cell wall biosynthesis